MEDNQRMPDVNKEAGQMVHDAAEEGLRYLDTRTDFWHQQKPMYARRYDSMMLRKQFPNTKTGSDEYIIRALEKIDEVKFEEYDSAYINFKKSVELTVNADVTTVVCRTSARNEEPAGSAR